VMNPEFELISLKPLDSLFFGDNMGLDLNSPGGGLRFPLPWTVSGALLYAHIMSVHNLGSSYGLTSNWDEGVEERGDLTGFMFYGPFLIWRGKKWFPCPLDLSVSVEGLQPSQNPKLYSSQLPPIMPREDKCKWIPHDLLERYSEGNKVEPINEVEEPIFEEKRLGIHLDDVNRTVVEDFLYTSRHIRLKDASIGVLVASKGEARIEVPPLIKLGGEGRPVRVTRERWTPKWLSNDVLKAGSVVKVVLLSPAIYRKNGKDVRIPELKLPGKPELLESRSALVISGPPVLVSGWDLKRARARKLYAAVPPGTVFYLKLSEDVGRWELTYNFWRLSLFWERGFGSLLISPVR